LPGENFLAWPLESSSAARGRTWNQFQETCFFLARPGLVAARPEPTTNQAQYMENVSQVILPANAGQPWLVLL
jgi:hypothetical protein